MTAPDKNTAKAVFWQHHIQQWRTAQLTISPPVGAAIA
ncbi:hypothetical protein MNBD_GAMMA09-1489 [hydrothermal vent metagenome]|uniref:Uncharacterized protein n=1 Tax=hydrothermal vent metagenome TaxID=652676 RepID=A0A3B0XNF8_9ZZZZ